VKQLTKGKVRAAAFVTLLKFQQSSTVVAAEPVAVTLELRELVKALENNAFFEEVVEIKVGDKVENVKIKALQRHPAKNTPMHADFKRA
jgi:ribosomal protein L25 (general stress protein Ctc)